MKERTMKTKIHAAAGFIGFMMIVLFWSSTVISELFGSHDTIYTVKTLVLWGMCIMIPAMAIVGATGMSLGQKRKDAPALAKKKRMPLIAMNGLMVLVPAAIFLQWKAGNNAFDMTFYIVQCVELVAGAFNLTMMGLNIRDGFAMTKRKRMARKARS
jgi:hypothetical protein